MVTIHDTSSSLWVEIPDPYGHPSRVNLNQFKVLGQDRRVLLDLTARHVERLRPVSQVNTFRVFAQMGDAFVAGDYTALPRTASDWQSFVLHTYRHALSRADRTSSLKSRVTTWNSTTVPLFEALRDIYDQIPITVDIPKAPTNLSKLDLSSYASHLIGDAPPKQHSDVHWRDKLLTSISLSRTDADYLEELRDELLRRRAVLHESFFGWWLQVKAYYDYGRRLRSEISIADLNRSLTEIEFIRKTNPKGSIPSHGRTEESLGLVLAILETQHAGMCSTRIFAQSPYLTDSHILSLPKSVPRTLSPEIGRMQQLQWMLGALSRFDIAVCIALLIMHNPKFTPHSIARARVVDNLGKSYLEMRDLGASFRIEKPRAQSMKDSVLDAVSYDIVSTVLMMGAQYRDKLISRGAESGSLLFVVSDRNRLCSPNVTNLSTQLTAAQGKQATAGAMVYRHFPSLEKEGLSKGSIAFSKIRATEGVLEWFRTGSVAAMARRLGNQKKTALGHYLPKQLIAIWNTRQIRRFQNLLLATASAGESYVLEATDFQTLTDLNRFLSDMLDNHSATSSGLAAALHKNFGHLQKKNKGNPALAPKASLAVSVSPAVLAALYTYQNAAFEAGVDPTLFDSRDPHTGLRTKQLLDLAQLLRHQLPKDRDVQLRDAHFQATKIAATQSLKVNWRDLFISRIPYEDETQ